MFKLYNVKTKHYENNKISWKGRLHGRLAIW